MMRRLSVVTLSIALLSCGAADDELDDARYGSIREPLLKPTDVGAKRAIVGTTYNLYFMSESDHSLDWVQSSVRNTAPVDAAFIHRNFNRVTNGDGMADKPLSTLKSETVAFSTFAAKYAPVPGEDPDNFDYHQKMTAMLDAVRKHLKNPIVIRFGRKVGSNLTGAISVYIVGTLPSGKVGGLFTVSVET